MNACACQGIAGPEGITAEHGTLPGHPRCTGSPFRTVRLGRGHWGTARPTPAHPAYSSVHGRPSNPFGSVPSSDAECACIERPNSLLWVTAFPVLLHREFGRKPAGNQRTAGQSPVVSGPKKSKIPCKRRKQGTNRRDWFAGDCLLRHHSKNPKNPRFPSFSAGALKSLPHTLSPHNFITKKIHSTQ